MVYKYLVILYTALALSANPSLANDHVSITRSGDMEKLDIHAEPRSLKISELIDENSEPVFFEDYNGKWIILNFWATWCAPCREEMSSLDNLQTKLPDIAVLPIATGRNKVESIIEFFKKENITRLPIIRDPTGKFSRSASVLGLPVTLVINPDGKEVARLIGGAQWDDQNAVDTILDFQSNYDK